MSRYDRQPPFRASRTPGKRRRFNLALFLPLGGMICVGITTLTLGILFYAPPEREETDITMPPIDQYQKVHEQHVKSRAVAPPAETTATERAVHIDVDMDAGVAGDPVGDPDVVPDVGQADAGPDNADPVR